MSEGNRRLGWNDYLTLALAVIAGVLGFIAFQQGQAQDRLEAEAEEVRDFARTLVGGERSQGWADEHAVHYHFDGLTRYHNAAGSPGQTVSWEEFIEGDNRFWTRTESVNFNVHVHGVRANRNPDGSYSVEVDFRATKINRDGDPCTKQIASKTMDLVLVEVDGDWKVISEYDDSDPYRCDG